MKYGFVIPKGNARDVAEIAHEAEQAGWDGIFVWETLYGIDAWVSLTAAAMRTERISLGTMLSPIARMRPWKIASEAATLHQLSNGRVILAVGLGAPETGWANFGEQTERKIRAELMDEGLEIVTRLWRGEPFDFHGMHYTVMLNESPALPPTRIPIWMVGLWGSEKSMRRTMKFDGLISAVKDEKGEWADALPHIRAMREFADSNRESKTPYDIVVEGETPSDNPESAYEIMRKWKEVGATWWIETRWNAMDKPNCKEIVLERIRAKPPTS
jgi:alkanesulfonate monooxygenase SsuD/methylene tetrahydromethanopterin reductase-like flavin-dependent oxidoreductase (luciferase family)